MIGMNTWCLLSLLGWAIFLGTLRTPVRRIEVAYPSDEALVFVGNNGA